ncbi:MoaB/Mog domain-containing protein [Parachaetomium inaequale]|uniref:MoaB/Mog domain-containing protein n=1 Tax=Parachaetomium inaequale TaxID=2588326 RepID=A0AAN6PKK9_9PEZI|nr:MoaB/Mog domain-containing protein [Parachaetomium inaequale]
MASGTTASERASRKIHTAACLIIGDEVLGGKAGQEAGRTKDTNSNYFAKWCFGLGINLKRIEVIEDDEAEIIEAVRRMSERYDFVVTSGGIGPTHDDITYQSIAKAFDLPLVLHKEAYALMKQLSKPHPNQPNFNWDVDSAALRAKLRMVELPTDAGRPLAEQFLFPCKELWVPVAVVNGNVHILPGVPRLFTQLLNGLTPAVLPRLTDPEGKGIVRVSISTPLPESEVAEYLSDLAKRVEPKGVKVGSYPRWGKKRNTVTLVGRDKEYLESITPEVLVYVKGTLTTAEKEKEEDMADTEE